GYADCRFLSPVYPGDTLSATSEVIGLRENSNKQSGVVYVRSKGFNQKGKVVLDYVRWVMVRKRSEAALTSQTTVPQLPDHADLKFAGAAVPKLKLSAYDNILAGSARRFSDYQPGEKIDHRDGMTVEEAEHQLATRLYQNTARVHFNHFT